MSYPSQRTDLTEPPPRLSEAELRRRMAEAFPEAMGPGVDDPSGAVTYGQTGHPRIGRIPYPSGMDPERRDRENREREQRWAAMTDAERAAAESMRQMVREEIRRA
jgi:hypothetical protein